VFVRICSKVSGDKIVKSLFLIMYTEKNAKEVHQGKFGSSMSMMKI